ncbi:MAG: Uma2 family endonuclease [Dehalococcoidia bacterium]
MAETLILDRPEADDLAAAAPAAPVFDVVDGVCVERDMSFDTSWVGARFVFRLSALAEAHGGTVAGSDGGIQIFGDPAKIRFPDASYLAPGRIQPGNQATTWLQIPPDLVVEVISPNDMAEAVDLKRRAWLDAGVLRVWLAYPAAHAVMAFGPDGLIREFGPQDVLTDEVVPGFAVPVASFFPTTSAAETDA